MPITMSRPPRTLFTGYKNAEIVGPPGDAEAQRATLRQALQALAEMRELGALRELTHT